MAGLSFVPLCPVIGSRLQKMSGVCISSFFSMPVDCSSFSGIPFAQSRRGEGGKLRCARAAAGSRARRGRAGARLTVCQAPHAAHGRRWPRQCGRSQPGGASVDRGSQHADSSSARKAFLRTFFLLSVRILPPKAMVFVKSRCWGERSETSTSFFFAQQAGVFPRRAITPSISFSSIAENRQLCLVLAPASTPRGA